MPESQKENPLAGFRKGFDPDGADERRARAVSGGWVIGSTRSA